MMSLCLPGMVRYQDRICCKGTITNEGKQREPVMSKVGRPSSRLVTIMKWEE